MSWTNCCFMYYMCRLCLFQQRCTLLQSIPCKSYDTFDSQSFMHNKHVIAYQYSNIPSP